MKKRHNGKLKNVKIEDLEPLWSSPDIKTKKIAETLGVSTVALYKHAKKLGLKARPRGRIKLCDKELFVEMWNAGVSSKDISTYFGYKSSSAARYIRIKLGLKKRTTRKPITIIKFKEMKLAERMKKNI